MNSISIRSWYLFSFYFTQYIDKRCELLNAFQEVDESLAKDEMDETENWEMTIPESDFPFLRKRKIPSHGDHKSPRLMLDDALTMVPFLLSSSPAYRSPYHPTYQG